MRARTGWLAVVLMLFAASVGAQRRFALTVDNIMSGPGLVGYEPSSPRWSGDSSRVYFEWKQPSDPVLSPMDTYVVARDGSAPRKLSEEESKLAPPVTGDRSEDKSKTVFVRDGDVFVYDHASDKARRLTKTADVESGAQFTRDGERVWFTRSSNLYAMSLKDGVLEQLTDIRPAGAAGSSGAQAAGARAATGSVAATKSGGEEQKGTDSQEALKKEERDLLDIVKQRAARREEEEARKKRENPRKPLTLQARQSVTNLSLSPDGKTAIVSIAEPAQGAKNTIVPNFVTETGYTEDIPARTKVGDVEGRVRVALISVADGSVKYVDHGQRIGRSQQRTEGTEAEKAAEAKTSAAGIGTAPARTENTEARGSAKSEAVESQDRAVDLLRPEWSNDGTKAVMLARSADNKDRWVLALDPATGKTRVLASVHDESWVGGPGALTLGWLKGDRAVYFQSERDGYSHLYTVPFDGGEPKQLTSGKWEVLGVRLSEDKSRFYLTTNEGDPAQVHLYSMAAEGGPRTKITAMPGSHRGVFSPDEKWIADVYSFSNKPPELHVMENRPGAQELKLTNSPTEDFKSYGWIDPPIVHFKARDGVAVPARIYKPAGYKAGGPAVVFVHGAGYLQNVHKWWSTYYREYMFHHLLMERGYLVLDVDYRGSAGYGRDWRTAIYRHMGGKDLDDHIDAARWLVSEHRVDPKRIGIYGGSYGGFITLMALFTQPDVFAAGAALRPVTDWAHYNNGYTANILNTPQKDLEAFRKSSPIYFAEGLKGALLICHGMVDVNVHFQDTVRLAQRLIELRKENWEVAMYPAEDHAFVQPTSWADEYKRILSLFERSLRKG